MRDKVLQELLSDRGVGVRIAKAVGVSPAAVSQWQRVPAEHVLTVEKEMGVSRHDLRPDIYPREAKSRPSEARP